MSAVIKSQFYKLRCITKETFIDIVVWSNQKNIAIVVEYFCRCYHRLSPSFSFFTPADCKCLVAFFVQSAGILSFARPDLSQTTCGITSVVADKGIEPLSPDIFVVLPFTPVRRMCPSFRAVSFNYVRGICDK